MRTSQPGCELQNPSPSAYTLQQTAADQNQAGRRSHQDLFGRRVHSEGTSMTPLDTSVTNKQFSVLQRFLLPTWHRSKGQEAHSDLSQGSRARLRYRVLPVCPHCVRHSIEAITYPENTSWQLTRWHCPHLTDEEPEAQRGKGLV